MCRACDNSRDSRSHSPAGALCLSGPVAFQTVSFFLFFFSLIPFKSCEITFSTRYLRYCKARGGGSLAGSGCLHYAQLYCRRAIIYGTWTRLRRSVSHRFANFRRLHNPCITQNETVRPRRRVTPGRSTLMFRFSLSGRSFTNARGLGRNFVFYFFRFPLSVSVSAARSLPAIVIIFLTITIVAAVAAYGTRVLLRQSTARGKVFSLSETRQTERNPARG